MSTPEPCAHWCFQPVPDCARLSPVPLQTLITYYFPQWSFFFLILSYLCSLERAFLNLCFASWFWPFLRSVTILCIVSGELWPLTCIGCLSVLLELNPNRNWKEFSIVKCKVKWNAAKPHFHHLFGDIPEFLCCLWIFWSWFSVWRCCRNDSLLLVFLKVISDLSALCLPIGSLSGCLRQTPSCVCWMVCNYPKASLGQSFKAPLQICCSIHRWTSVLREQREEREHTENENYTYRRMKKGAY